MAASPMLHGLSRPQRVWLRRLYKEGGHISSGNRTLYSLKRLGLVQESPLRDRVLETRWHLTDAGKAKFAANNPSSSSSADEKGRE